MNASIAPTPRRMQPSEPPPPAGPRVPRLNDEPVVMLARTIHAAREAVLHPLQPARLYLILSLAEQIELQWAAIRIIRELEPEIAAAARSRAATYIDTVLLTARIDEINALRRQTGVSVPVSPESAELARLMADLGIDRYRSHLSGVYEVP